MGVEAIAYTRPFATYQFLYSFKGASSFFFFSFLSLLFVFSFLPPFFLLLPPSPLFLWRVQSSRREDTRTVQSSFSHSTASHWNLIKLSLSLSFFRFTYASARENVRSWKRVKARDRDRRRRTFDRKTFHAAIPYRIICVSWFV